MKQTSQANLRLLTKKLRNFQDELLAKALLGNSEAANKQAKRVARFLKVDADEKGFCNKSTRKKPLKLSFSAQLCKKMQS